MNWESLNTAFSTWMAKHLARTSMVCYCQKIRISKIKPAVFQEDTMKRILTLFIALALLLPLNVLAQTYNLDLAHTTIQFKVKNLGIFNVTGVFEKFNGTVDIDDTDISKSKVDVSIDTASINTGINMRDKDLRSDNFFDALKFPTMTFVSTKVETGSDNLKVIGNLTIKGVTKQVVLKVEGPKKLQEAIRRGVSATATVNRQDFGVSSGKTIADEVFVTITAELVKQ
jgi:polyisoprenoid-binding protein YceI